MYKGTILRGIIFCSAMSVAAFAVSSWITSGIVQHAALEISLYCAASAALASAFNWFPIMSNGKESRNIGLVVGFASASATFPIFGVLAILNYIVVNMFDGSALNAELIGQAVAGGIGFTLIAAILGSIFAFPIAIVLGFAVARNL